MSTPKIENRPLRYVTSADGEVLSELDVEIPETCEPRDNRRRRWRTPDPEALRRIAEETADERRRDYEGGDWTKGTHL